MGKVHDLTGLKFGRLTVVGRSKKDYVSPSGKTKKTSLDLSVRLREHNNRTGRNFA